MMASSPYGQQQLRPELQAVSPRSLPCGAKCFVPCPTATSCPFGWHRACLATHGGMRRHGRAQAGEISRASEDMLWLGPCLIGELAASTESKPHGLPQGLFDLHCRSTPKAFTSILNGLICLSPPLANTEAQGVFHLFIELRQEQFILNSFFYSMEKSKHF